MKKLIGILLLAFFAVSTVLVYSGYSEDVQMNQDPKLEKAFKAYEKGTRMMERGEGAFYKRPGEARALFHKAESYFQNAAFLYKELGTKNSIDTAHEVQVSDELARAAHVKIGMLKRDVR